MIVRTRASRLMTIEGVRQTIARRRQNHPPGRDAQFALCVDVRHDGHWRRATLIGPAQADAAAAGAAGVARLLIEGNAVEPGAWMPEQIVDPGPFLSRLAARGLSVKFPAGPYTA